MRFLLLIATVAIVTAANAQESFNDLRPMQPAVRIAETVGYQFADDEETSGDSRAIVAAIEALAGKFDRLQIQVDRQRGESRPVRQADALFDSEGRQVFFDRNGQPVLQGRSSRQQSTSCPCASGSVNRDARAIINQICPDCRSDHTQSHNFTSTLTHSPTAFSNIPLIDSNNNMGNAIARVIMVEGRPQLILDPEPVSFLEKFISWRRR